MIQVIFIKEKVAAFMKMPEVLANEMVLKIGEDGADFMMKQMTAVLEGYFFSAMNERKTITVTAKRPSFFDWILRRKRQFFFEFKMKDVFKNPPLLPDNKSYIIYEVEEKEQ